MAKSIGATLSLNDGNFFSNIKSAITGTNNLKTATTNATGSLKKMGTQGNATGGSLTSLAKKVVGVVAAYAGFRQVVAFMSDCVTGVMELERANTRLETLMMNVKGTTKDQVQEIIKYGDALEMVTTIESDATVAGASQLATFQLNSNTIKTIMPAFQDLAVAQYGVNVTQEQMIQSGNLIGKVMMGSVGALTKAGVSFTKTQENILKTGTESQKAATLVEVLGDNFGGLAKSMAQTPEGRIKQLKNAWGSVKDEIGFAVLPIISRLVSFAASKIPQMRDTVTNAINGIKKPMLWIMDNILPPLKTAFIGIWKFGVSAFNVIKTAVQANASKLERLKSILLDVRAFLFYAFEKAKPTINWLKDVGLPLIVNAVGFVLDKATGLYNFISSNWGAIEPIVWGIVAAFIAYKAIVMAVDVWNTICAISTGLMTMAQWALNTAFFASPIGWVVIAIGALVAIGILLWRNWDKIGKFFKGLWSSIKNGAVSCWNGISNAFMGVWNFVVNIFSGIINWVKSNWISIVAFIINPFAGIFLYLYNNFEGFRNFVNRIISSIGSFFAGLWNKIVNVFTTIGTTVGNAIGGAFKTVVNTIISFAENTINGFLKAINWSIDVINKIPGVNITKLALISIPKLAEGGIIERSGRVLVGERGPEYLDLPRGASVTPLHKADNTNNITINVYADGKSADEIVDEVVPKLKLALANL